MIFRQLFDAESSTYTYFIASRPGAEALIIDPVKERLAEYLMLIEQLGVRLVKGFNLQAEFMGPNNGRRNARDWPKNAFAGGE